MFEEYGMNSFMAPTMGDYFNRDVIYDGQIRTAADLKGQGLMNGDNPASVYSLYANHGAWYGYSVKQENTQLSFKASGSADIKSHEVSFGFEFEEREDYYWQFNAWRSIWSLMRAQANKHILERDLSNPNPLFDANGVYQDTVNYDRLFIASEQSDFDRNFRISQNVMIVEFL